jgi:hypothetical protein
MSPQKQHSEPCRLDLFAQSNIIDGVAFVLSIDIDYNRDE